MPTYISDNVLLHYSYKKKCIEHVVEKIKTRIFGSVTFFSENHAVCEIMWQNTVEPCRP